MATIEVTIVRADTNQAFDVELPDDADLEQLVPEVAKEMGLPRTDDRGQLVAYEFSSKRTGADLRTGTLASRGVKAGDVLLLTSSFVAGIKDRTRKGRVHAPPRGKDVYVRVPGIFQNLRQAWRKYRIVGLESLVAHVDKTISETRGMYVFANLDGVLERKKDPPLT